MLRPGSGISKEQVLQNQRERIFGATVAVVAEKGYDATTIADLVELSGVSRSDFYEHFAGKEECLLATVTAIVEPTTALIWRSKATGGPAQAREVFDALIGLIVSQAAASKVCFVEVHAVGPRAEALVDRSFEAFERVVIEANKQIPGHEGASPQLVRAVIGGLRKIIHTRLYRGEAEQLLALRDQLWDWGVAYRTPPEPLRSPRRVTGEAPQRFYGYTAAEQILAAVAEVIAEKGYQGMSSHDVAERASISLSTFYSHFADKEDAVLAALERSSAQMMASVGPAVRRAADWRLAVRAAFEAMLAYFAAEPAFARLVTFSAQAAGPRALAQRDRVIGSLVEELAEPARAENPGAPAIAAEATAGTIYALLGDQVRRGGAESLPEVAALGTYITLVPFVGAEVACAIANGSARRR